MTNKEAITYLEWLSNIDFSKKYPTYPMVTNPEQVEALEMAITALQVQDKLQDIEYMCRLSGGVDYFRVFAALLEKTNNSNEQLNNLNDGVKNANSNSTNEIKSRVKGLTACRVPEVAKDTNVLNNDTISRAEAIDAIIAKLDAIDHVPQWVFDELTGVIGDLPSVQPEIIHCAECKWLQCNMRPDGTLPKGVDEFECRHWCGWCDPMDFCSHAERKE